MKKKALPQMGYNIRKFKEVAVFSAKSAGDLLLENFGKKQKINYKSDVDLLTEIDKKSEKLIIDIITKNFPGHNILSEESKPTDKKSSYKWIIDPLDGTTNYAHNFPFFCVAIALEIDGEIRLGVVYNPILNELFFAEKGKGAYLNNKKIKVSEIKKITNSLLATGFPYDIKESKNNNIKNFINFSLCAQAVRRPGSASLDQCYVAMGRLDGFWELKLNPWDMAAGSLIVKEAGGKVTDFSGKNFSIYKREIVASNGIIHSDMIDILKG